MPTGLQVRTKISNALAKLEATSKTVSFRNVVHSSGDALLGLGQTETVTDTVISPPPAVELLSAEDVARLGGDRFQLGDYLLTLDGSIAESTLQSRMILYGTEVLKIVHYEPSALDGIVVAWQVYARGVKA